MMLNFARRLSNNSRRNSHDSGGGAATHINNSALEYGDLSNHSSEESSWPSDASDKESLQSWKKNIKNEVVDDDDDDDEMQLAAKEEEEVRRWFLMVTALMVLAGTGITVYTYYYLTGQEEDEFERSFQQSARSIADAIEFHTQVIQQALLSKSQALTTFAAFTGASWPMVSIPDFQPQGQNFLAETNTAMISWAPLINSTRQLMSWQAYSTYMLENSGWFESEDSQERLSQQLLQGQEEDEKQAPDSRTNSEQSAFDIGLYFPIWQISPQNYDTLIKYNMTKQFEDPIFTLLRTKQPVWTPFVDMQQTYEQEETRASFVLQPVFRALPSMNVKYDKRNKTEAQLEAEQQEVVAIYIASVQWDIFLADLVPEGTSSLNVVLKNNYGGDTTYQVEHRNGNTGTAMLIGKNDWHSSKYDDMAIYTRLSLARKPGRNTTTSHDGTRALSQSNNESSSSQAPSVYSVAVYPTQAYENSIKSKEPLWITIVMAVVFSIGIISFHLYARFVHNRQQKLAQAANRAALVVKQLFPSNVRDRIMQEAEESHAKRRSRKGKKHDRHGSSSEKGGGGGNSILGGVSLGSVGSRYSRASRSNGSGGSVHGKRKKESAETNYGIAGRKASMSAAAINPYGSNPIADHFAAVTVLFADMVGFTAWSSVREPTQVFTLLETVYHAFDKVARKRGIFKVETIGDCYVAVCGLPVPRPDHAIAMSYFGSDCLRKMHHLAKKLEVTLGPDTADLTMRVGIHSGPVTAGVLRGEKSRFQLFGDTVNTTARVETNGKANCIHVSEATANLLKEAGKARWLTPRKEKILAKGKGEMQTYWLEVRSMSSFTDDSGGGRRRRRSSGAGGRRSSIDSRSTDCSSMGDSIANVFVPVWAKDVTPSGTKTVVGDRFERLVDWNVEQLINLVKKIVSKRKEVEKHGKYTMLDAPPEEASPKKCSGDQFDLRTNHCVVDQQTDVIAFPEWTPVEAIAVDLAHNRSSDVELDSRVVIQLHELITSIAKFYQDNAFHNFAHASHCAMAVLTWLSRVEPPPPEGFFASDGNTGSSNKGVHALSEPTAQFALVFSALVHDCSHPGVDNKQLVKEQDKLASTYKDKSIHEQASVDLAFETLMDSKYADLRKILFGNEEEFHQFRQIVINCVLSTDILDDRVLANQNVRWGCLFQACDGEEPEDEDASESEPENEGDQKASVVLERLLVVSNIAHTMQHWYVYRKWNEKLFEEHYDAFKSGKGEDPSLTWYEDELEFFDNVVIPLASSMKDCKLFDSSCGESLNYALQNRETWKTTGKEEIASMLERFKEIVFQLDG